MLENIKWLGNSGFKLISNSGKIIYIDPFKTTETEKADLILITHEHYDHCSPEDVIKLSKPDTIIVTVPDCQSKLALTFNKIKNLKLVEPGKKLVIEDIEIEAVPAYNIGKNFHRKENDWVGFIINMGNKRIYHAGDTDLIPEMSNLKDIDLALIPIGGTYTMNSEEAAKCTETIKPKIAIPMHYGTIVGTLEDAEKFKKLAKCEAKILSKA
ncbi:MBL fold metallo-hydrolase [Candidatus Woesearchaeota archaeon]|nr:hypothetical protein [uncultured archaeon]MBS3167301.1 MBL fold metallo-hydrolase [Candidatus Woesearchaeota archaeon]